VNESLWTFVFEVANFVALAAALAWLFFKPVRKALEDERAKARRLEEEAEQKLAEATSMRQEIELQHKMLARELETMRNEAREAVKREVEQTLAEARAQIERERATLKRQALHIERSQTAKIARAVATATRNTTERFLEQLGGPELERALIEAACRELKAFSNDSLAPVTVETATSLDDASRQLVNTSLRAAAKTADFRVVPELKGGLRISTARGLIDASITGLANFAEQSLSAELESMIREESESE
jgi:F0F1-type ATP synthase membrane subunit b/b'